MGLANKAEYNAYMAEYMLKRYHAKRKEIISQLGGCCAKCGSTDQLEIDHSDAKKKTYNIAKIWNYSNGRLQEELKKCQLLCAACHSIKSIYDRGMKPAKGTHGTLSSANYCDCDLCKQAKKDYAKQYAPRRRELRCLKREQQKALEEVGERGKD